MTSSLMLSRCSFSLLLRATCVIDKVYRRIGVYRLERCGWEADRNLLKAGRADMAVLERVGEFRKR